MLNASGESHGDCVEWLQWTTLFDASPLRCPGFANYPTANWLEGNCQSFGKQRDSCPFHALPSFIDDWLDCRRHAGGSGPSPISISASCRCISTWPRSRLSNRQIRSRRRWLMRHTVRHRSSHTAHTVREPAVVVFDVPEIKDAQSGQKSDENSHLISPSPSV